MMITRGYGSQLLVTRGYGDSGAASYDRSIACVACRNVPVSVYYRYLPESIICVSRDTLNTKLLDKWIIDRDKVKSISQNTSLLNGMPMQVIRNDVIIGACRTLSIDRSAVSPISRRTIDNVKKRTIENNIHTHPILCNTRCCNG